MFLIAYAFKGQVHVYAGRVKIVSHLSCRTSAILKYFCPLPRIQRVYLLMLQVLTKEYYAQQTGLEKSIAELESKLQDKEGRLQTYEKLEKELDDVVMQAAEGRF